MKAETKLNTGTLFIFMNDLSENLDALNSTGDAIQGLSDGNPVDGLGVSVRRLASNAHDVLGQIYKWLEDNGITEDES